MDSTDISTRLSVVSDTLRPDCCERQTIRIQDIMARAEEEKTAFLTPRCCKNPSELGYCRTELHNTQQKLTEAETKASAMTATIHKALPEGHILYEGCCYTSR